MEFVELAAIDNDRYIVYSNEDIATFDNDHIMIINLDTLTKMHPDSEEFKKALDTIKQCLPNMLVRIADPEDVELFEDLKKYFYNPTQIHGFDIQKFLGDIFDFTSNESLKKEYESLDRQELQNLETFFEENSEYVDKLNKALKDMDSSEINEILEEIDLDDDGIDMGDISLRKVYELDIIDMVEKNSPMKNVIKETFDLAADDQMRKELAPRLTELMGAAYKNVYYSAKESSLYVFTDPRLKKVNKVEWWPDRALETEEWKQLNSRDDSFKKTIANYDLSPKNARLWKIPLDDLIEEEGMVEIVNENQGKLRGHEMKDGMEPWFKDEMGEEYLDMFIEPGSSQDRKAYIFVEPDYKPKINEKWWPKKSITIEEYEDLKEQWSGFKKIDEEHYGSADDEG